MALLNLNILINDTTTGETVLNIERTQAQAPTLQYKGGDDEFQSLIASTLSFNMLVNNAADGFFLHLFTGNETHYQVQLEEASTNNLLWQGHLLPDQYSEPYENGALFVNFTATDGIGRLKNKYLPASFYTEIKSVAKIIAACLELTANKFNIIIAPAITCAVKDITFSDIEIDTTSFLENNKKKNAYQILEDVLVGYNLFQYGGYWYVIGVNRKHTSLVNVELYNVLGEPINTTATLTRTIKSVVFETTPQVSVIAPFKTVSVNWKKNSSSTILPTDVVYQLPINQGYFDYVPRYWQVASTIPEFDILLTSKSYWRGVMPLYFWGYPNWGTPVTSSRDPFYLALTGEVLEASIENNYAYLNNGYYIEGGLGIESTIDVSMEFTVWILNNASDNIVIDDYKGKILYEILIDNQTVVSNKASFDVNDEFDFELTTDNYISITGRLNIKDFPINKSGYVNVKLHPVIEVAHSGTYAIDRIVYTKLEIKYKSANSNASEVIKNRNIDFTTIKEVDVVYGSERSDLTLNKLLINPAITLGSYQYTIPAQTVGIAIENYLHYSFTTSGVFLETVWETVLYISEATYQYLNKNRENIYVKRVATGNFELLTDFYLYNNDVRGYVLTQYNAAEPILQEDEIYVKIIETTITETDDSYLRASWKRVGYTENVSYIEAMARMYHSTVQALKFKIEGSVFGLVTPLDILQFRYLAVKNYNALDVTLKLDIGMSSVIMIESVNKQINDYE
ncbi:hypothetical protein ACFQZW_12880 [Lutibacter aestuarii]|uniref:Uncharacterized protein n=1 Tax=Lutibacter aestuarii TaxID=861111 RepID=A0ABW2ZAI7_9FLAO